MVEKYLSGFCWVILFLISLPMLAVFIVLALVAAILLWLYERLAG